jgi:hypothetical protein
MATLSELRKSRSSMFEKITKSIDSGDNKFANKEKDERFWSPTRDKEGNASATIRFLPSTNDESLPWVQIYSFGFQGPSGKWYINESPATIGKPDPVSEINAQEWSTGDKVIQDQVRKRKRRTSFISNIVVLRDSANPENNGKTFLFKYGKKIHDMIKTKSKPEFEDDTPIHVYDIWEGANLKLRVKSVVITPGKPPVPNYDSSEFDSVSELFNGDEDKQQAAIDACHDLSEFIAPSKFKSYDTLKAEYERVMGATSPVKTAADRQEFEDVPDFETTPKVSQKSPPKKIEPVKKVEEKSDDKDDDMEYFRKLMESDD